ncbi:MAG: hypothetical protein K0U28_08005 [Cyanobacteria bacterium]|nr:hypothetical protein [Cyanobacteriota bacterium]
MATEQDPIPSMDQARLMHERLMAWDDKPGDVAAGMAAAAAVNDFRKSMGGTWADAYDAGVAAGTAMGFRAGMTAGQIMFMGMVVSMLGNQLIENLSEDTKKRFAAHARVLQLCKDSQDAFSETVVHEIPEVADSDFLPSRPASD